MADLNVTVGADLTAYNDGLAQAATAGTNFANNAANGITNAMNRVVSATDHANEGIASSIEEIRAWDAAARNSSQRATPLGANLISPDLPREINSASIALQGLSNEQQTAGGRALSYSANLQQVRSGLATARSGVLALTLSGQGADRAFLAFGHHFSSLINETGSVEGAFKSLSASLIGVGGIILGITLAVEAWHNYAESQAKAKEAANEFNKTIEDGQAAKTGEVANLNSLLSIARDTNESYYARANAVKEINRLYPEYLGHLTVDAINSKAATDQIKKQTDALIRQATAQAIITAIAEDNKKIAEAGGKSAEDSASAWDKIAAVFTTMQTLGGGNPLEGYKQLVNTHGEANKAAEIKKLTDQTTQYRDALDKVNKALAENNEFDKPNTGKAKKDKTTFFQRDEITGTLSRTTDQIKAGISNEGTTGLFGVPLTAKQASASTKNQIIGTSGLNQDFQAPDDILAQMQAYAKLTQAKMDDINISKQAQIAYDNENNIMNQLTDTIGNGLTNAFQTALAGGQNFVTAFGQILLQLIERLIAAAAAAAILSIIIGTITGGTSIAASLATGGGGFKALFGSFSGFKLASGGITNGPTRALIGEGTEREAVMPLSKLQSFVNNNNGGFQDGQIVGVLRGSDLLLQINRANKSKQRVG